VRVTETRGTGAPAKSAVGRLRAFAARAGRAS
jgi:hypothetical protein